MRPSFLEITAVVLSSISFTLAFDTLSFSTTVTANKDAELQIVNDISSGSSSFDAQFSSFRVYLAITPPGWGTGPACYLVNSSAIATTDLTIQIPASVGPDGSFYSIATMEFNQDPNADGPSGFQYSNDFSLSGGTGEWTQSELAGQMVGDPDNVPCTAYNCARNCSQTFYPANVNDTDAYEATYNCTAACPGVTYLSWADMTAEEDGGDGSAVSSSTGQSATSSGSASSTSKATMTGIAKSTASATGGSTSTSTTSTSSASTATHSASAGSRNSAARLTLVSTIVAGLVAACSF